MGSAQSFALSTFSLPAGLRLRQVGPQFPPSEVYVPNLMLELPDYCYFFAHKRKHRLAGDSNTTEALGTFCRSSQQNFPLVSGRTRYPSQLTIVFKSDLDVQYTGFQAKIFTCKSRLSLGWNPLKLLFSVLVYAKPIKRHDIFLQQPQLISATQI